VTPALLGPLLALAQTPACRCPCPPPAADTALVHVATPEAFALNRQGRDLYRQRRWSEARQRYRAALAADPAFVAPRLNLATAFAQDERFAEAVAEAAGLVNQSFVPWGREVREAADLAPLAARPEKAALDAAFGVAAAAWGSALDGALLLVARTAAPVTLPPQGVLYLGLAQEIFAYLPQTGHYRQVTAEDGRVLGFVRSPDRRTLVYVRAGKLLREAGAPPRLRGLHLRRLYLPTMTLDAPVPVPGDVERLQLVAPATPPGAPFSLILVAGGKTTSLRFDGRTLSAGAPPPRTPGPSARLELTGQGAAGRRPLEVPDAAGCGYLARDQRPPTDGTARIRITDGRGRDFTIGGPHGAGLSGLPFP
jgi:hypothetical protein